ncbi:hypothetical protein NSP_43310 [Nodularia spumigena CCY9414]|nr:hypothetical protein NSP_43310 [Nodularia spumigena CCY9414]EAW43085.1 hypothetical protein N9414_18433 [Nodularia spumigena CCY9414]
MTNRPAEVNSQKSKVKNLKIPSSEFILNLGFFFGRKTRLIQNFSSFIAILRTIVIRFDF